MAMLSISTRPKAKRRMCARRVRLRRSAGSGVKRHVADAGEHAEQQDVEPTDLPQLARQPERGLADQPPLEDAHATRRLRDPLRRRLAMLGGVAVEHVGHDVARDRGGGLRARVAVLDHERQRVSRRVVRRVGDEQRVRPELPGQVVGFVAVLALLARHVADLHGAGLARQLHARHAEPARAARCRPAR